MRHGRQFFLMLAVLAVLAAVCWPVCGCGTSDAGKALAAPIDSAKDVVVKTALQAIRTGIDAQFAMDGSYPATVSSQSLGQFVSPWPQNPFTNSPMAQGTAPGDIIYSVSGGTYHLAALLSDGTQYVVQ